MKFDESQVAFIESKDYPYFCLANAGSGKSTSLLAKAKRLAMNPDRDGKILILCFNRGIQDELQGKIAEQGLNLLDIEAKTIHGLGRSFIEEVFNKSREPINILSRGRNYHLYFGPFGAAKDKYKDYPGLIEKVITQIGGKKVTTVKNAAFGAAKDIGTLAQGVKLEAESKNLDDPKESAFYLPIATLIEPILKKFKNTPKENIETFSKQISGLYIQNIVFREKVVDFGKFFLRHFFRNDFVDFIHNAVTNFIFKKDLFAQFADNMLDSAPMACPLFYLYANEAAEPVTYAEYSELLDDTISAIALSDLMMQFNEWRELDFDSMLSLGAYALHKSRNRYYAVLVDEAQDLNLFYWYLSYVAFPKHLIKDKESRVFFVGDALQAINRWNGASTERFITLANKHSRGQLIYTYRCPEAIVAKAQQIKDLAVGTKVDLAEDRFISAAPEDCQPGLYKKHETLDPSTMPEFMAEHGYHYSDIVILGRTNKDLLPWQLWALIENIPCDEILVNKLDLTTDTTKLLLSLVALADYRKAPDLAISLLVAAKGRSFVANFLASLPDVEDADELILRHFMSITMKDEDELTDDELQELATGRGTIALLRTWYADDTLKIRTNIEALLSRAEFTFNYQPNGLTMSTIHRFKGREKNVAVMQSNAWASICRSAKTSPEVAEESCLAYVGVTRAKWATHVVRKNTHPVL